MIDSGDLDAAEREFVRANTIAGDQGQQLEIAGLWGRLFKQRYIRDASRVGSADAEPLRRPIDCYLAAYAGHGDPGPH